MKSPFIIIILIMFIDSSSSLPPQFDYISNIDPSIIIMARYFTKGNFVGDVINGYKRNTAIITKTAGAALSNVQSIIKQFGYTLVVYDAYRPQKAVNHFYQWSLQPENYKTKQEFYPFIDKSQIIPQGYVALKSGHSRGSTVDLTIMKLGNNLHDIVLIPTKLPDGSEILYRDDGTQFMCGHFDFFGQLSHHDSPLVSNQCLYKRNLLKKVMMDNGFRPLKEEWWHYTLNLEPFPNTYFDFDVE